MRTVPSDGTAKPEIIRMMVVLPQPLGPSREQNCPFLTSNETSFTAVKSPHRFETFNSSTSALDTEMLLLDQRSCMTGATMSGKWRPGANAGARAPRLAAG